MTALRGRLSTVERPSRARSLAGLILSFVLVGAVAAAGAIAAKDAGDSYQALDRPDWAPPSWLFAPAWVVLYLAMAIAAWRVWRVVGRVDERALVAYGIQLLVNLLWTPLFFALERRGWALVDIIALDVLVALTTILFWRRDRLAGALLVPYLGWVLFATALNLSVVRLS